MDIACTNCAPVSTFAVLFRGMTTWSSSAVAGDQQVSCRTRRMPMLPTLMLSRASAGDINAAVSYLHELREPDCCPDHACGSQLHGRDIGDASILHPCRRGDGDGCDELRTGTHCRC